MIRTSTPQLEVPDNASRTVAVLADLIDREVNQNRWVANDPSFQPGYLLDNMPAYQIGMMSAVGRFTTELRDRIARVRGSSAADPDLERAAGQDQLSRRRVGAPEPVWPFVQAAVGEPVPRRAWTTCAGTTSGWPRGRPCSSAGPTTCWPRWTGSPTTSARPRPRLTLEVDQGATNFLDFNADNLFYSVKGKLYAYYLILRELGHDYATSSRSGTCRRAGTS